MLYEPISDALDSKRETLQMKLTPQEKDKLRDLARRSRRTMTEVMRILLDKASIEDLAFPYGLSEEIGRRD